ncbi:MAG: mechanosensitive ion channel [Acidobacteria bacterium]|nr:mechanosensitive ion channel [Acidobacteriota bacterium]
MATAELQKRFIYFVIFAGVVILILIAFPFVEGGLRDYVLARFGLDVVEGQVVSTDGVAPTMMTTTMIGLVVNLFHIAKIFLWMALVISIVRFVAFLLLKTAFRGSGQSEISSLLKTVISIIVYIVAFFIIFQSQYPGVQLAPLFTGSTIIGIVVGLALQDTLGNLFAGIALQADQPFQVGDVVAFANKANGVIEAVSWRGVKIRTFQNKLLVISNSVLGKESIEVAPKGNLNARIVFFNTLYSNSPAKTIQIVRDAVRQVENVSQKIRPIVRIRNLGENGLDWEVKYWADDYTLYNDTDALIRQRIWYAFQRDNIHFAYPTRTVFMQQTAEEPNIDEYLNVTVERLSRIPIFAPLSDEELHKLARASKDRVFAPGEAIVRRGQEGNSMFVVTRGTVDVEILQGNLPKVINTLRESDYFGEMSLLTGEPRTATVRAQTETEVVQINKSALKPIFEGNPELVESICKMIEERKAILNAKSPDQAESTTQTDKGVMASIRKFFGIK